MAPLNNHMGALNVSANGFDFDSSPPRAYGRRQIKPMAHHRLNM